MDWWLIFAAGAVFVGGVFIYVLFMIFLPEWVGITGKTAIEAEKSHRGDSEAGPEFLSRFQREHRRSVDSTDSGSTAKGDEKTPSE